MKIQELDSHDLAFYCGPRYGWFCGRLVRVIDPDGPPEVLLGGDWLLMRVERVEYLERE